jgi:hypothetical protein
MNNDRYTHIFLCDFSFSKTQVGLEGEETFFFVITTREQLLVGMVLINSLNKLKGTDWNKWYKQL